MHTYFLHLWRPITICIAGVIGDHLCVLCSRACSVVKKPFCLSFFSKNVDCVWEDKTCIPFFFMKTNHHLQYKCHWGSLVCFVYSDMFYRQKTLFPCVFQEKLYQISANETKLLNDCVWEDKTCMPISFMETNQRLYYKCHWGSFLCFVFSHMFCRQKTFLPFVLGKTSSNKC